MPSLKTLSITFILLVAVGVSAVASVPQLLSYQGRLTDLNGNAVADGSYDVTFAIYDEPTSGNLVWEEEHPSVTVSDGLFNTVLGSLTPLTDSTFSDPNRYLQITVNGEQVGARTQFTSSGYAFRTATIDGTTGGTIVGTITILSNGTILAAGGTPPDAAAARFGSIVIGFDTAGAGSIAMYEPVDSKSGLPDTSLKKVQVTSGGIIMFGSTEDDTTLTVAPNGDIVGVGQITMGQNSSPGTQTTVLGFENTANGDSSAIGGGSQNVTNGVSSTIAGGHQNTTDGTGSSISGGAENVAGGDYSTVGGGQNNSAAGNWGTVPGGQNNNADAERSYAAGYRAKALHNGSFVWADDTEEDFATTADNQFIIRASGGVGIGTNQPVGQLDVVGPAGDSSVNLPDDAISAPEIKDEPGLSSSRWLSSVQLPQKSVNAQELTNTTITVPADGYIIVRGLSTLRTTGSSGRNQAYLQIEQSPPTGQIGTEYAVAGAGDYDSPNREHFFSITTERIFPVTAGTYTFVLEAQTHPDNGSGALTTMMQSSITAIYLPTAYGSITTAGPAVGFGQ